jgi:hypothetical protein
MRRARARGRRDALTESVRAHVADSYGLTRRSGSRRCRGSIHLAGRNADDESTADPLGSVQLSAGERPRPGDGSARAGIVWRFGLEQPENPLCAVGGPCGDETSLGFAERLGRPHRLNFTKLDTPTRRSGRSCPARPIGGRGSN